MISDTEVKLKRPLDVEMKESSTFKVIPKLDQTQLFSTVWDSLHAGQAIGIFPEGSNLH